MIDSSKIVFVTASLILVIIIACCKKRNPIESNFSENYFPLQIGNEWTFEFPIWTPSSGDTLVTVDYKIITTKKVNGKTYYCFNYGMPFFPDNWIIESIDSVFIRQNEKGDILLLIDGSEWLYFDFDASMLDSLVRQKIKNANYFHQIESINDTVVTPVGLFNNYFKILTYFPDIIGTEHYTWFSPGYGPVKIYYPELNVTYQLVGNIIQNN